MKKIYALLLFVCFAATAQQENYSSVSKFLDETSYYQINMDATNMALFKSGMGESVAFYPSEIINLKSSEKIKGLAVESIFIVRSSGMSSQTAKEVAWIGMEEVDDMILWFESYVIPNLKGSTDKDKSVTYLFNSKEVMIKFEINNRSQMLSIILNNSYFKDKYFWTETKVKNIPEVLEVLKFLKSK